MCIIIDTNAIASVFNPKSADYPEFQPVETWIRFGQGKVVYGGSKYLAEIRKASGFLAILAQLTTGTRAKHVNDILVDSKQAELEPICTGNRLNDPHILAIVLISGCRLVCSKDKGLHKLLSIRSFYPKKFRRPSIYSNRKHIHLLCNENIVELRNCV